MEIYELTANQETKLETDGFVIISRGGAKIRVTPLLYARDTAPCDFHWGVGVSAPKSPKKVSRVVKPSKKYKLLASAGSKAALEKMINKKYYSTSWTILPDNTLFNPKLSSERLKGTNAEVRVIQKKDGRWRYEMVIGK